MTAAPVPRHRAAKRVAPADNGDCHEETVLATGLRVSGWRWPRWHSRLRQCQIAQVTRVEPRQSIGFNLGYFALRGDDSRVDDDVLFADLEPLLFEVNDFNSVTFGGEWLFGIGDYIEAGVGVGYYQRTVPSDLSTRHARRRHRDRTGSEAARRSDDGHGAIPAARPRRRCSPTWVRALVSSTGATARPASSSTSVTTQSSGPVQSERQRGRARSSSAASAPVGRRLDDRRRVALAECRRRHRQRRRFPRRQDRSGRLDDELHGPLAVLIAPIARSAQL